LTTQAKKEERLLGRVEPHPVEIDGGRVALREAGHAAQDEGSRAAIRATRPQADHARFTPLEELTEVADRRLLRDALRIDRGDAGADRTAASLCRLPRHYYRVEGDGPIRQRELKVSGSATGDPDG